jgi:hypothetical protein
VPPPHKLLVALCELQDTNIHAELCSASTLLSVGAVNNTNGLQAPLVAAGCKMTGPSQGQSGNTLRTNLRCW